MIDNLFLEKQKKYFDEFINDKENFLLNESPKITVISPLSQDLKNEIPQEKKENVDPLTNVTNKPIKNELRSSQELKLTMSDVKKEMIFKDEEINKKDKSSLLTRIQNSLKDLTSYTSNEKLSQIDATPKNKEEKTYFLESETPKNKDENVFSNNENDLKSIQTKLNQTTSLLNLKMSNVKSIFLQNKKKPQSHDIRNLINPSKTQIKYGNVLPGYIMEDDLEIQNRSSQNLSIKVLVVCHNSELDDHDEYIYSIRKLNIYDYNEKIVSVVPPHNIAKYKIALKVPNLKGVCTLKGSVIISIQGIESTITLPISSYVEIPDIFCPKEIFDKENSCSVIKFALKKGKKQDCKIPFKNSSSLNLTMEFEFIEPEGKKMGYDLLNYPNTINIAANGVGILNVILKPILNIQPENMNDNENEIRRVLLAKVKNSSMIYYFPLSIEIY